MKYYSAFLLFVLPFFAIAQANYQKGSVTVNDGKVLSGYIDVREWDENPKSITFKETLDDKHSQIFSPAEVKTFSIDGFDTYVSYTGKISLNPIKAPELRYQRDTTTKYGQFFLMQVTTGDKLTLYAYTDDVKTRLFIQEEQEEPFELAFQQYTLESSLTIRTEKRYVNQLIYLASKYNMVSDQLKEKIERANYDNGDIKLIVKTINGTQNIPDKKAVAHTRFFIGAAINVSKSGFDHNPDFNNSKATTTTPKFSFGVDIFNNPNVQQFMLRLELGYSYVNPNIAYSTTPASGYTLLQQYTYNQYNITLTPQLVWNIYNKDEFKVYVNIGIGLNVSKYSNHTRRLTQTYNSTTNVSDIDTYDMEPGPWLNFPVQTGLILKKRLELFACYTPAKAFTKYSSFSVSLQTYSAGFHYMLGKKIKK